MSQITRSRLARGVKLAREHVYTPLAAAATELAAGITADQLREPFGTFGISFHLPVLGRSEVGNDRGLLLPFVLPPFQEFFDTTGQVDDTVPAVILDEIMVSWDQRAESAAIRDIPNALAGEADFEDVGRMPLTVRLLEKTMRAFDTAAPIVPDREVVAVELPALLWQGEAKQNPFILTGLDRVLHPYRTYALHLLLGDGLDAGSDLCMPSLLVRLKCRAGLTARDVGTAAVQNIPTIHGGAKSPAVVVVQTPAANSQIEADGATGVQTNVETLDGVFAEKLRGGYDEWSDVPPTEHLADDACYEVIAVPLFGFGAGVDTTNITRLPFVGAPPYTLPTGDRRIIPLKYPVVVHHVIAVVNWQRATPEVVPTSGDFKTDIGVALGAGLRSDLHTYQQVAYVTFDATDKWEWTIDQVRDRPATPLVDPDPQCEILTVPLVYPAAAGSDGVGYQVPGAGVLRHGRPVFAGKAHTRTQARSPIASGIAGALGAPATRGQEQFLEVRWTFGDAVNGLGNAPTYPAGTVFVGYGGHWVFIICKKHLAG